MSRDRDLWKNYYSRRDRSASNEQETIIIANNSEKNRILKDVLTRIDREAMAVKRQDVVTYKLTFTYYTQAVSIIVGIILILDGLIFLTVRVPSYLSQKEILSWVIFGEAGLLCFLAGLTVPRRSLTFKSRNTTRRVNQERRNLIFAFTHTLSWLTAAICLALISTMIFYY